MKEYFASFKKRNSSPELARFVAIGFILIGHCCVFSGYYPSESNLFGNSVFYFHDILSQVGNGLFIAILSYYLFSPSSSSKPTWKRILSIYLPCVFYSLTMYMIFVGAGHTPSETIIHQTFFPVIYNNYWFVRAYILFLVIYPFYYKMLLLMKPRQHFVFMMVFFISIMALHRHGDKLWGLFGAIEFLFIFTVIGFFKRIHPSKPKCWYVFFPFAILGLVSLFAYVYITLQVPALNKYRGWMNNCVSLLVLPVVICLFYAFLSLPEFHLAPLNYVARATFGCYLINGDTCNIQYWMGHMIRYFGGNVGSTGGIMIAWSIYFFGGLAIEMIRMPLFELGHLGYNKVFNKIKDAVLAKKEAA